jgi:DNA-directed RNA polymerase II subunit RPB1
MGDGESLNIVKSPDNAEEKKLIFRMNLPHVESEGNTTTAMFLSQIESALLNDLTLKGIPAISKCSNRKMDNTGEAVYNDPSAKPGEMKERKGCFIIETDGVALKEVLAIPKVDQVRSTSNNIREILMVLGIEASRYSLLHELRVVLGSYDIYVNYRHLGTLCDIMTTRGHLMAITRHGINRVDSGALRKCSFEETVEILLEASMHAEVDPLSGVTENIIMGQLAPYGTGAFDVMVDTDMLKEASTIEDPMAGVDVGVFFTDDECDTENAG